METNYDALMKNDTHTLVFFLPSKANIFGYKWVYKFKYNLDGNVEHFKSCLVVKGFHQTPSIDCF